MHFNHFEKEKSTLVYDGIIAKTYHREFGPHTYEYVVLPNSARVIAATKEGKMILLKEKTFSFRKTYLSLPGGIVDENETPEEAATRELKEETGFNAEDLSLWFCENYSQTVISNKYFYIARGCFKDENVTAQLEETEQIETMTLDFDDFLEHVIRPEFKYMELQNRFLRMKLDHKEADAFKKRIGVV